MCGLSQRAQRTESWWTVRVLLCPASLQGIQDLSPPYCGGPVTQTVLELHQTAAAVCRQSQVLEWGRPSWSVFWVFLPFVLCSVCDAFNVCAHRAEPVDVCVTNHPCFWEGALFSICFLSQGRSSPVKGCLSPASCGLSCGYRSPSLCSHKVEVEAVEATHLVPVRIKSCCWWPMTMGCYVFTPTSCPNPHLLALIWVSLSSCSWMRKKRGGKGAGRKTK